jgi:hypothetical protein
MNDGSHDGDASEQSAHADHNNRGSTFGRPVERRHRRLAGDRRHQHGHQPAMVHSGQAIAFVSDAANLAPGDGFLSQDVFLRFP